jgi:hypothetical protein
LRTERDRPDIFVYDAGLMETAPSAGEVWRSLIEARFKEIRATLPSGMVGAIEVEIARQRRPAICFHFDLSGPTSAVRAGRSAMSIARIRTNEALLDALLFRPDDPGPPALSVEGDTELAGTLFAHMSGLPGAQSWISVRR